MAEELQGGDGKISCGPAGVRHRRRCCTPGHAWRGWGRGRLASLPAAFIILLLIVGGAVLFGRNRKEVTYSEYLQFHRSADLNGDGVISKREFKGILVAEGAEDIRKSELAEWWYEADGDRSGGRGLDCVELKEVFSKIFGG